jgi:hypothetical protein
MALFVACTSREEWARNAIPMEQIPFFLSDSGADKFVNWSIDYRQRNYYIVYHWINDTFPNRYLVVNSDTDIIKFITSSYETVFTSQDIKAASIGRDSSEIESFIALMKRYYSMNLDNIHWNSRNKLLYFMRDDTTIVYLPYKSMNIDSIIPYSRHIMIKDKWFRQIR